MDEIDAYINQIEQNIINFKKAVRAEEAKQVAEIKEKLAKDMAKKQDAVYEKLFKKVIKNYYAAYDPKFYKRLAGNNSGGLFEVLDLPDDETTDRSTVGVMSLVDGGQMSISKYEDGGFVSEQAPAELFRTTFELGYHGGATKIKKGKAKVWGEHPSPGTPFWRKGGVVTAKNGKKIRHRWARWHVAAFQSEAPKDLFESAIQEAEDSEIQTYFIKTGTKYCQEVEKNIAAYATKLAQETF